MAATRDALNAANDLRPRPHRFTGSFSECPRSRCHRWRGGGPNSLQPQQTVETTTLPFGPSDTLTRRGLAPAIVGDRVSYNVEVLVEPDDSFWSAAGTAEYQLFAVPNEPTTASLAAYPDSRVFGQNLEERLATGGGGEVYSSNEPLAIPPPQGVNAPRRWRFPIALSTQVTRQYDLVVRKRQGSDNEYRPLASHVRVHDLWSDGPSIRNVFRGQYFAFNGTLSNFAARVMAVNAENPAKPAFDGFGLPDTWLPPTDPALFGGTAGDDAIASYLRKARFSAEEATAAVHEAFEQMLKQQQDEAALAAAVSRSAKISELERSALCGSASCDASTTRIQYSPAALWDSAPPRSTLRRFDANLFPVPVERPTWSSLRTGQCRVPAGATIQEALAAMNPTRRLDCITTFTLSMAETSFTVLTAVAKRRTEPTTPSFSELSGGTLQQVAVEQWTALRALDERIRAFIAASDAALGHIDRLSEELVRSIDQNVEMAKRCELLELDMLAHCEAKLLCNQELSPRPCSEPAEVLCRKYFGYRDLNWNDEAAHGTSAGSAWSAGISYVVGASYGQSSGNSTTPVSLGAKRRLCQAYQGKVDDATWSLTESVLQVQASLQERASAFTEVIGRIQAASATGATLKHQTELAIARGNLDVELLRASQATSFGLYRQIHSYDAWRAKSLLEASRLAAAVARKAIESRYVVDLSTMNAAEPLVASPSSWANEVYEYDLDMPSAVGLAVGEATRTGLSKSDARLCGNLERFVNGFSIAPTAVADDDTELLSLPGPNGLRASGPQPGTWDGRAFSWSYFCPDAASGAWLPMPPNERPSDACGGPAPTRAKLLFALDPWGRLYGDIAEEPFESRYNARWDRLAVNLVGTGVLDCSKSRDPSACYTQPFVRYRMAHRGPAWVTASNQSWSLLPIHPGQIDGGKALAAEQWLDPISNSWSRPYVSSVTRREFLSRPFGGSYEIEFDLGPEVTLERIDRVQVLAGASYWVAQR